MKRHKHLIVFSAVLGLLLTGLFLCGLSAPVAGTPADIPTPTPSYEPVFWSENFWGDPLNTYITATVGSGVIEDYSFLLTQDAPSQAGRIFYLTPNLMDEFSASFSLYLGSNDGGADGAAFIFCPEYDYAQYVGGTLDASCSGGYIVAFDTYEPESDKVYVAFNDYINRLQTVGVGNLEDGSWHTAVVIFNQGTITVVLDGSNVIDGFTIPDYSPFVGYFGFSAATGGAYNRQLVDNIHITVPSGQLDGHVYDGETLESIAGANVTVERQEGGSWNTLTDPSGYYSMTLATGTYTVTAETDSLIDFASGVEVLEEAVTSQDLYLIDKVTFEPTPLHVTLDWQTTGNLNATLENRQPWEYDFEFYEQFGGFLPAEQGAEMDSVSTSSPESDAGICADALCEEVYGNTTLWGSDSQMDIGNIFEASEDTVIHEIRAWLNFSAPTDMYFFVYEGEALTGEFNKIFEVHIAETSTGAQWHSSGPIAVPAQAGKFYYVGASWNGAVTYYGGGVTPIETDCFGTLHTGAGLQAYYPPAATIINRYDSGDVVPIHFVIVTGRYDLSWFGQEPLAGTVPASNATPGEISASMLFSATYAAGVNQPGDYYTTLLVHGDPTLQVPVTMTVLPPVDMGSVTGSVTDNCTGELMAEVQVAIPGGDPIDETWTDEDGNYTAWLYPGSYELTFSIPGYLPSVEKVDISAGLKTPLNVKLVPERACIQVYPQELEAWVLMDTLVFTHPTGLDISNNGGVDLNFGLFELEGLPALVSTDGSSSITSLGGSYVEFDPSAGGDATYIPGTEQTFCFRAESYTNDYEWVKSLWERFPEDWSVQDVYVQGTPTCDNGGSWGPFSWLLYNSNPYEIRINHQRTQAYPSDHCTATYCFEVTSGAGGGAPVSWYWLGEPYADTPHYPCSDDVYTPDGQPACDEWINPPAFIPSVIDIPWLWEEPTSGNVPALSSFNVDILFSSVLPDPLPPGTYAATLWISENDPISPNPQLPVSMHVVEAFIDPVPSFESNEPLCLGETAVFTNTSVEGVPPTEYYLWDFGDGMSMTTETTETVTHDYAAAGSYTVSLTAHQKQTDVEVVFTDTIEIKPLPLADFSYTMDGLIVAFTNVSANATIYTWDFGDGSSSDLENPTHTYDSAGVYTIGLTAYGGCGMDQVEKTIAVGYIFLPLIFK